MNSCGCSLNKTKKKMNKPDFKKIAMKVVGVGVGVAAGKGIDKFTII
jgi:hypothetical protein